MRWLMHLAVDRMVLLAGSRKYGARRRIAAPFADMVQQAKGSEVKWFMWGGSTTINSWVDTYVAGAVKEKYGITLKRVPADAAVFVNKLLTEKQAGGSKGSMDLLWINGENFKNAMENGLLQGPVTDLLPNFPWLIRPPSNSISVIRCRAMRFPTVGPSSSSNTIRPRCRTRRRPLPN